MSIAEKMDKDLASTLSVEELLEELYTLMSEFKEDAEKVTNKAAARRARRLATTISKSLKMYRKLSIK